MAVPATQDRFDEIRRQQGQPQNPRMAHKCLVIMQILGNRKYDARKKSFAAPCLLDFRKWNGRCLDLEIGFDSRLQ